jgi:hypothetical protein
VVQIVNLVPTSPVEAHLIVSDVEARLPGGRVMELIAIVQRHLGAASAVPDAAS